MIIDSLRPLTLSGLTLCVVMACADAETSGQDNFQAMREWNRSEVYRKTIGLFADRLAGR